METYGVNFREIKDAQDFLAALVVIQSQFELLNEKTSSNIDINNIVVSELDKAKSIAMYIKKSHEKHIEIIEKTNKIIEDIDNLPEQFKKQSKEALSEIDMQPIKAKIEFLLNEQIFGLSNSINIFKNINNDFSEALATSHKNIKISTQAVNNDLIKFKEVAEQMGKKSILHFVYGFVSSSIFCTIFYFIFLNR